MGRFKLEHMDAFALLHALKEYNETVLSHNPPSILPTYPSLSEWLKSNDFEDIISLLKEIKLTTLLMGCQVNAEALSFCLSLSLSLSR